MHNYAVSLQINWAAASCELGVSRLFTGWNLIRGAGRVKTIKPVNTNIYYKRVIKKF